MRLSRRLWLLAVLTIFMTACSNGGSDDPNVSEGRFVDSPVSGLYYISTPGQNQTDVRGTFKYVSGDIIDFYIGGATGIHLGSAQGTDFITPFDLLDGGDNRRIAINIARLLMGLDTDGDYANGIQLSEAAIDAAKGLNLTSSSFDVDFANFPPASLLGYVQSLVADLPDSAAAESHLACTLQDIQEGREPDGICDPTSDNSNSDGGTNTPGGTGSGGNGNGNGGNGGVGTSDADNDGVNDPVDQCPDTPAGESVDSNGCSDAQKATDSDGDGVNDSQDQCPNTPQGQVVNPNGCSATQQGADEDSDGVKDPQDQCLGTPNGETVDSNGCSLSQLDDDNDGISNAADQCPGTPTGEFVNGQGCSASQLCTGELLCVGAAKRSVAPSDKHIAGADETRVYADPQGNVVTKPQKFSLGGYGLEGDLPDSTDVHIGAGYATGNYRGIEADGNPHSTYVRVMVVEEKGGDVVAFITLDAIGAGNIIQKNLKAAVTAATGIPFENILFGQTHSHSAADLQGLWGGVPATWLDCDETRTDLDGCGVDDAWTQGLYQLAADATKEAMDKRTPANLNVATGEVDRNRTRTMQVTRDQTTDKAMTVLQAVSAAENQVVGTILQYAAHPTILNSGNRDVHTDYVLSALVDLENQYGGTALYYNGPIADVAPSGGSSTCPEGGTSGYCRARNYGKDLANDAINILSTSGQSVRPTLTSRSEQAVLPVTNPLFLAAGLGRMFNRYYNFVETPVDSVPEVAMLRNELPQVAPFATTTVSRVTLGDPATGQGLEIATIPGEGRNSMGQLIRRLASSANGVESEVPVMLLGLTHNSFGYIVPEKEFGGAFHQGEFYEEVVSLGPLTAPLLRVQAYFPLFDAPQEAYLPDYLQSCQDSPDSNACILDILKYRTEETPLSGVLELLEDGCYSYFPIKEVCALFAAEPPTGGDEGDNGVAQLASICQADPADSRCPLSAVLERMDPALVAACAGDPLDESCVLSGLLNELQANDPGLEACADDPTSAACLFGQLLIPPSADAAYDDQIAADVVIGELLGCDFLDPNYCMYPFPSDHFTAPDNFTDTGKRINFNMLAMPRNTAGKPIDPTEWNRNDGFSPGQLIQVRVPGVDLHVTDRFGGRVAMLDRLQNNEVPSAQSAVMVFEVDEVTGSLTRHPVFAEIDANVTAFKPCNLGYGAAEVFGLADVDDARDQSESLSDECFDNGGGAIPGQDPNADPGPALLIRPAKNFHDGKRYIVALANLMDSNMNRLDAPATFKVYRDNSVSNIPAINARRPKMDSILGLLAAEGVDTSQLYMAWDFTVASTRNLAGRLLHMRDDALYSLDTNGGENDCVRYSDDAPCVAPKFKIDRVENTPGTGTNRKIFGRVFVPSYLTTPDNPCDAPTDPILVGICDELRNLAEQAQENDMPFGAEFGDGLNTILEYASLPKPYGRLFYEPDQRGPWGDGLPDRPGRIAEMPVEFVCSIPAQPFNDSTNKARPNLYGHGLLGGKGEGEGGSAMNFARDQNFMPCAIDWIGMSTGDIVNVAAILTDVSHFPVLADRSQQGMVNWHFLTRALRHKDGLVSDPAFQNDAGEPLFDNSAVYYDGNSQGAIMGGAVLATSSDIERGTLGVFGMNYSTLLRRSVDFNGYGAVMYSSYRNSLDQSFVLSMMQMLWDRAETNGYINHLVDAGAFRNMGHDTPDHQALIHVAFGDHQVADITGDVAARTIGAGIYSPTGIAHDAVMPGRHNARDKAYWGIDVAGENDTGSVLVVWDIGPKGSGYNGGNQPSNIGNTPPFEGRDPHSDPRSTARGYQQKGAFMAPDGHFPFTCKESGSNAPCFARDSYHGTVTGNVEPVVNVAADVNASAGAGVSVVASASDANTDALVLTWAQTAGPSVSGLRQVHGGGEMRFTAPACGDVGSCPYDLTFEFTADDGFDPVTRTVTVHVSDGPVSGGDSGFETQRSDYPDLGDICTAYGLPQGEVCDQMESVHQQAFDQCMANGGNTELCTVTGGNLFALMSECHAQGGAEAYPVCNAIEVLVTGAASYCRQFSQATSELVMPEVCSLIGGVHVMDRAVAEFTQGWTGKALALQYELNRDLPMKHWFFPSTHNSFNHTSAHTPPTLSGSDSNQFYSIVDQLRMGIRGIEIDVHWMPSIMDGGFRPTVCHGNQQHFGCTYERSLRTELAELNAWLEANPDQVVVLDLESNMGEPLDGPTDVDGQRYSMAREAMLATVGDRLYTPAENGSTCNDGQPVDATIADIRATGSQLIIYTGGCDEAWGDVVFSRNGTHTQSGSGSWAGMSYPDDCRFSESDINNKWTRMYEDATLVGGVAGGASTSAPQDVLGMTRCGVNMPSLDKIHPEDKRLEAFVWSWDYDQPADTGDCALLNENGRFEAAACGLTLPHACVSDSNPEDWQLSGSDVWNGGAAVCPAGYHFAVPGNGRHNEFLKEAAAGQSVWLNYSKVDGEWQTGSVHKLRVSIADAAVDEGNAGENPVLSFPVTLTGHPGDGSAVSVELSTDGGWSATEGDDYEFKYEKLIFTGNGTQNFEVTVNGDDVLERYDYLTVNVGGYSEGVEFDRMFAVGTIQNDDEQAGGDPAYTCGADNSFDVNLDSAIPESDGDAANVHLHVFEPDGVDCNGSYPIVLFGNGWGGGAVTSTSSTISTLLANGFGVASIAPRGFGGAGGMVRVMDPDFEGQDYLRAIDWMENKLSWAKRNENGHILLGGNGVSYGGGFQLLILAVDSKNRMVAPVPGEAWTDLDYSLNPGNVVKTFVASLLSATGLGAFDPYVNDIIATAVAENRMHEDARRFFRYHGLNYFCQAQPGARGGNDIESRFDPVLGAIADAPFVTTTNTGYSIGVPPRQLPPTNALFIQGFRDQLFNFNEAATNYQCLNDLGGDVRLMAGQVSSHMAFGGDVAGLVVNGLDYTTFPIGVDCGNISATNATMNWYRTHLLGDTSGTEILGYDDTDLEVCMATSTEGMFDFVGGNENGLFTDHVPVGGVTALASIPGDDGSPVNIPAVVPMGLAGANPTVIPLDVLGRIERGSVLTKTSIAGVPTAKLTVTLPGGLTNTNFGPAGEESFDSILFVGIGHHRPENPGVWDLMEDQVQPVRGLGTHEFNLVGVAERLQAGDQIALLVYGYHPQYLISQSRDPSVPLVMVSGTVELPLHE